MSLFLLLYRCEGTVTAKLYINQYCIFYAYKKKYKILVLMSIFLFKQITS